MPTEISELPEDLKALANKRRLEDPNPTEASLSTDSLICAFGWSDTPEGHEFWSDIYNDKVNVNTSTTDTINPDYYKTNSVEVIDMMIKIWGKDAVITHCEMCAFKYRMRLGNKPNNSVNDDLGKAKWYESKANELKTK